MHVQIGAALIAALLRDRRRARVGLDLRVAGRALPRRGEGALLRALLLEVRPGRREDRADALQSDALDLGHRVLVGLGQLLGRFEPVLVEQLGSHGADARNGGEGGPRAACLVLRLGLAAHVEVPAREPGGEPYVVALPPDGEGELVVGDDHLHRVLVLVHDDLRHLGGCERAADVHGRVARPGHDVDLLAAELLDHGLHPGAAHAHASADRIDVVVVRDHGDLRPPAGFADRPLHLDDALVDLGYLLLEELDEQTRVGTREGDLGSLAAQLDVEDEGPDAVALAVALTWDLLRLGQDGVRPTQVDDDVLLLEALHDPGEELALAALELVVDDVALSIPHALDDVLLGGLGGDAAEYLRRQLGEQLVADLGVRIELDARLGERHLILRVLDVVDDRLALEEFYLAQLGVELGLDVLLVTEGLLGRRQHRLLERLDDDVAVDALLLAHLLDDAIQVRQHGSLLASRVCSGPAHHAGRDARRGPRHGEGCHPQLPRSAP